MIVEVCANSFESALNAEAAGADRLELCTELAVGGMTPSHGLLQKVIDELSIPVNVLIRPRGGDFTYTDAEFDVMKRDIQFCKDIGCNGIVAGILSRNIGKDHTIDIERTKVLVELAKPLSFTFHRAFDWVANPQKALEQLATIGVDSILTSGQESTAEKGIELLTALKGSAADSILIMPGGGIHKKNILQFKSADFKAIHFSATNLHKTMTEPKVSMYSHRFFKETQLAVSNIEKISDLIALVK